MPAHIIIRVTELSRNGTDETQFDVAGTVSCTEGNGADHNWSVVGMPYNSLAATINAAIRDAAVQAMDDAESITVGALDRKTLFGGAIGL